MLEKVKGKRNYDTFVAYSGGKDSTYTLMTLKQDFGLKVLAVTLDHGFVFPMALKNIRHENGGMILSIMFKFSSSPPCSKPFALCYWG